MTLIWRQVGKTRYRAIGAVGYYEVLQEDMPASYINGWEAAHYEPGKGWSGLGSADDMQTAMDFAEMDLKLWTTTRLEPQ